MSTPSLKLIFAGTPDFAAEHLAALIEDGHHEIVAVYTQPDRPAGRGKKPQASAVKACALAADLPVYQPLNFKDAADRETLAQHRADVMVVVAYGLILPAQVLSMPHYGCINVHASILPRWRGAAPIHRAIETGDEQTGVTIMQMDAGLDTGDMLNISRCAIAENDTTASLHDKLIELGCPALLETLQDIALGQQHASPQDDSQSNYARKIEKPEAVIDWQQTALHISRKVRAFNPFPICHTTLDGQRIKIWQVQVCDESGAAGEILRTDKSGILVACGEGSLLVERLQLPGAKAMSAAEILNSKAALFSPGTTLGNT